MVPGVGGGGKMGTLFIGINTGKNFKLFFPAKAETCVEAASEENLSDV